MCALVINLCEEVVPRRQHLQNGSVAAICHFFRRSIQSYTAPSKPQGCLLDVHLANASTLSVEVHHSLQAERAETSQILQACLDRALLSGELSTSIDPQRLTRLLSMFLASLSSQARAGTPRDQLLLLAGDLLDCVLLAGDSKPQGGELIARDQVRPFATEENFSGG